MARPNGVCRDLEREKEPPWKWKDSHSGIESDGDGRFLAREREFGGILA